MRTVFIVFFSLYILICYATEPVFKNPGFPDSESYEIKDYIDDKIGFVIAKVDISVQDKKGEKIYHLSVNEGNIFFNEIDLNYNNLTTISEKRTDLRDNTIVEQYINLGNNKVYFMNKEKKINKVFNQTDSNIYSRYAYFFSFSGFPFETAKSVTFKSYMFEYGDALNMKVTDVSNEVVKVKTGTYNCYKLELMVAGWQSVFASDKYYLYFSTQPPHQFIKYEEKEANGLWNANELFKINN